MILQKHNAVPLHYAIITIIHLAYLFKTRGAYPKNLRWRLVYAATTRMIMGLNCCQEFRVCCVFRQKSPPVWAAVLAIKHPLYSQKSRKEFNFKTCCRSM